MRHALLALGLLLAYGHASAAEPEKPSAAEEAAKPLKAAESLGRRTFSDVVDPEYMRAGDHVTLFDSRKKPVDMVLNGVVMPSAGNASGGKLGSALFTLTQEFTEGQATLPVGTKALAEFSPAKDGLVKRCVAWIRQAVSPMVSLPAVEDAHKVEMRFSSFKTPDGLLMLVRRPH